MFDCTLPMLAAYLKETGQPSFRARQIFEWIYQKNAISFDEMTNIPAALREQLAGDFEMALSDPAETSRSADGVVKFLYCCRDGERIETVVIPTDTRVTVCVSTQAGCKFGCGFCASGIGGWRRHLTSGEIIAQLLLARRITGVDRISHVVFMGTGEPLENLEAVLPAIEIMNDPQGLHIAARRITISTCGIIPKIKEFAGFGRQVELAVSLHGFDDRSRGALMPVNTVYPLKELVAACREYTRGTGRQITFEYIVIPGVTLCPEAPAALARLLRGITCKINLIAYNRVEEFDYDPPSEQEVREFCRRLKQAGVHATVRVSRGQGVAGACGQLRHQRPRDERGRHETGA